MQGKLVGGFGDETTYSASEDRNNLLQGKRPCSSYNYYKYKLSKPVICTLNFRNYLKQGVLDAKIVPLKCGETKKYTQEGIIRVPEFFDPYKSSMFLKVKVAYFPASNEDFERTISQAKIKVYFRGFPLRSTGEEIKNYFSAFGQVEHAYLMQPTKGQFTVRKSEQGYIIFASNDSAHSVLNLKGKLYYKGSKLFCDVYEYQKKKGKTGKSLLNKNQMNTKASMGGCTQNPIRTDSNYVGIPQIESSQHLEKRTDHTLFPNLNLKEAACSSWIPISRRHLRYSPFIEHNTSASQNLQFNYCKKGLGRIPDLRIR